MEVFLKTLNVSENEFSSGYLFFIYSVSIEDEDGYVTNFSNHPRSGLM